MARHLYSALFYLITPFALLRLLWRSIQSPAYRNRIQERFGFYPHDVKANTIWIHCVSVGETLAAAPLIESLLNQYSHSQLLITNTTPTGFTQAKRLFGKRALLAYAPYDLPGSTRRFLKRLQPTIAVFIETEVWPNIIHYCQEQRIPTALINARMSAKSYKGYHALSALSLPMFNSFDVVSAQSEADATRLKALGACKPTITGSLKHDFEVNTTMSVRAQQIKQGWQAIREEPLTILIAASTHNGEDELILEAFKPIHKQFANCLLLLAPRHPERFESVFKLCREKSFATQKFTDKHIHPPTQIVLVNTMGELQMLFGTADIAIMGGTFIDHGGHNFLEPAAWGLPIVSGKSCFNFTEISNALINNHSLSTVKNASELTSELLTLLVDTPLREKRGLAAKGYIENNRGAVNKNLSLLKPWLTTVA